jgi:B-cell receptor-associated protein 31
MVSFLFLVTPFPRPVRKRVLTGLAESRLADKLKLSLKFTFVFILILFVDSVNRVYRVQAEVAELHHRGGAANMMSIERSEVQARKFYSQRNMYLCGFTLFLSLILNRTYALVIDLMVAQDTIAAVKSTSNEAIKSSAFATEIDRLEELVKQKDVDLATLKKQSEALSREYHSVSEQLNQKTGVTGHGKDD